MLTVLLAVALMALIALYGRYAPKFRGTLSERLAAIGGDRGEVTFADRLTERRSKLKADLVAIAETALAENRDLTDDEMARQEELRASIAEVDKMIADERSEAPAGGGEPADPNGEGTDAERAAAGNAAAARIRVGREPRTYERWDVGASYFADMAALRFGLPYADEARDRINRHGDEIRVDLPRIERRAFGHIDAPHVDEIVEQERRGRRDVEVRAPVNYERRDLDRGDGAGGEFVPPLWMIEEYINVARAGRIVADLCRGIPLPMGTDSINIPRILTGTTAAPQTADLAAVSETDMTTDSVQAPVRTIAGQQDVALQLLEQSPIAFDQVVFGDLADDHAEVLDGQVINGSGVNGQVLGILQIPGIDTTAYTDASPTVPELHPKVADSLNQIATTRHRAAEAILMHPRRWYWHTAALDGQSRPLVVPLPTWPTNAFAAMGAPVNPAPVAEGLAGNVHGHPVWTDANMPTGLGGGTEDAIICARPSEYLLFEGAVRTRALPQPLGDILGVRFQLYSYAAFMPHRRPQSTSIVSGTGLAAPTF